MTRDFWPKDLIEWLFAAWLVIAIVGFIAIVGSVILIVKLS